MLMSAEQANSLIYASLKNTEFVTFLLTTSSWLGKGHMNDQAVETRNHWTQVQMAQHPLYWRPLEQDIKSPIAPGNAQHLTLTSLNVSGNRVIFLESKVIMILYSMGHPIYWNVSEPNNGHSLKSAKALQEKVRIPIPFPPQFPSGVIFNRGEIVGIPQY